jgi:hypothetical protein
MSRARHGDREENLDQQEPDLDGVIDEEVT